MIAVMLVVVVAVVVVLVVVISPHWPTWLIIAKLPSKTLVISYILLFYTSSSITVLLRSISCCGLSLINLTNFFVKTLKELSFLYYFFPSNDEVL